MPDVTILACELGGTNLSAMMCSNAAEPIGAIHTLPTMADSPKEKTLANLRDVILAALAELSPEAVSSIAAVGFAAKGPVDTSQGRLIAESLPSLMGFNLSQFIWQELSKPLFIENNANCFALAEALRGAGAGAASVVGVNLGTGFGCGIVIGGQLLTGSTGNAGELEWCLYDGKKYDDVLSARGAVQFFSHAEGKYIPTPVEMAAMARSGDSAALRAWASYGVALGEALGKIAAVLDPAVIVLGGSGAQQSDLFSETCNREMRRQLAPAAAERILLRTATLGRSAGLIGAALHALISIGNGFGDR